MLLIGIDEAGYGPSLGPLCHGVTVFSVDTNSEQPENLFMRLAPLVSNFPPPSALDEGEGVLCVDDSKKIYTHLGLLALARTVRIFQSARCSAPAMRTFGGLLQAVLHPEDLADLECDAWGRAAKTRPELSSHEPSEAPLERALVDQLNRAGCVLRLLAARVLPARAFNARLAALGEDRNKADLNWERAAACLKQALEVGLSSAQPGEPVHIAIDRQGGRKFYMGPLTAFFDGAFVQTLEETPGCSAYRLEWQGHPLRIEFRAESESQFLPVALASMAAKLARELCMERFNAHFSALQPGLKPTAGYPQDARRYLKDIASLRKAHAPAYADAVLIRKR